MHVLLIHQVFCLPSDPGGTRHYELLCHLVGVGHRATVVASDVSYVTGRRFTEPRAATAQLPDGLEVVRAYTPATLHRSFLGRVWAFLVFMTTSLWRAMRVRGVDVVMGTSPPIFQTLSAWLVARLKRCAFLLEVRDLWPEFAVDIGVLRNPLLIWLARRYENWIYRRADHIIVNSPYFLGYLAKKGVPKPKLTLVANGVDPEMFDPEDRGEQLRKAWGASGRFVVTYAGALGLANDIPTLLRAARGLRDKHDVVFWLVGDGAERSRLEQMAREWNLANVRFCGKQPKSRMSKVLAASDACVAILKNIPMFRTTYPNKVFDYMAAGRPVILGIDGVIREVVEKAGCGIFVPPGDSRQLGKAVAELASDKIMAATCGRAGRDYVQSHFQRRKQAEILTAKLMGISGCSRSRDKSESPANVAC